MFCKHICFEVLS